tara:strand:+ start:1004 stop:3214 length:2211 start_codon:yes stop_codon:yes gene_type:complete
MENKRAVKLIFFLITGLALLFPLFSIEKANVAVTGKALNVLELVFGPDVVYFKNKYSQISTVLLSQKVPKTEPKNEIEEVVVNIVTDIVEEIVVDIPDEEIEIIEVIEIVEEPVEEAESTTTLPIAYAQELIPVNTPFFGGGGGGVRVTTTVASDTTAPDSPTVTIPADFSSEFSTTTISFSGTAENNSTVQIEYYLNTATTTQDTTADSSGNWSLSNITFGQGTTTTNFYATDGSGNKSSATTVSVGVDTSPDAPIITSPTASVFATTTIEFTGTATSTLVISNSYSSSTTTADVNNEWSLTLEDFSEGTTTISFYSTDNDDLTSQAEEYQLTIDTTPPSTPTLTITECSNSLSASACLSPSTTANLSWTATSTDISYYGVIKDNTQVSTTTDTDSSTTLSNGTYSMEIVAYDEVGNSSTSTSQSIIIDTMPVIINEIAWSGTASSSADEWIELYNRTSYTIDLSNVTLSASDEAPYISLSGTITSNSYYLIERTDDTTTSVTADLTSSFSELSNTVEILSLIHNYASTTLDSTPSSVSWSAGTEANNISMERIDLDTAGTSATNWSNNNTYTKNGTDVGGNSINGTPKSRNSVNLPSIGYYQTPETSSYISGGYYATSNNALGLATYISPTEEWWPGAGSNTVKKRRGALYRGTVASSTVISSHLMLNGNSEEQGDIPTDPVQGEDYFVAIHKVRTGPAFNGDTALFQSYFESGANAPPHLDYGILEWKYGTAP